MREISRFSASFRESQASSISSLSSPIWPSIRCAMALASARKKLVSKRRGKCGGVIARQQKRKDREIGHQPMRDEILPDRRNGIGRRCRRACRAEGRSLRTIRGWRQARKPVAAAMGKGAASKSRAAERASSAPLALHHGIVRFKPAAGKRIFAGKKGERKIAPPQQDARLGSAAVDQNDRRRRLRCHNLRRLKFF